MLFAVRVVAQPLALLVPALPPCDAWASGVVPYPLLLASQIVILVLLGPGARRMYMGAVQMRRRRGQILLLVGAVYFASMALRFVLGTTILRGHAWFDRPIPT